MPSSWIAGVDLTTSLAMALRSRPGAYAVLLGSGVSTGAGIPTGWDIVTDLCRQLAIGEEADPDPDPVQWYQQRFGKAPTYTSLMEVLAPITSERQAIVARYLAAEDGTSRPPAPAHHALARLMASGLVTVVLTTNFDRLLEQALAEAHVTATVLSTPDAVAGALPLQHAGPVVVKLHGDQMDPAIRNIDEELEAYEPAVDTLLDRIFDEWGLIVCGWSADHDTALARAIARSPNRRFTTWWTARNGNLSAAGAQLAASRQAEIVPVGDADQFFGRLADTCEALADNARRHPASIAAAVGIAKRELAGRAVAIPVHDAIRAEAARIRRLPLYVGPDRTGGEPDHHRRVSTLLAELELLCGLVATTAYWGAPETTRWWMPVIEPFCEWPPDAGGDTRLLELSRLPATALLWSAGIAAAASGNYELLARTTTHPLATAPDGSQPRVPAALLLTPDKTMGTGREAARTLYLELLRPILVDQLGLGVEATVAALELWQYLIGSLRSDVALVDNRFLGQFWPHMRVDDEAIPVSSRLLREELAAAGRAHPLFTTALFRHGHDRAVAAMDHFDQHCREIASQADHGIHGSGGGILPSGVHYPGRFDAGDDGP